MANPIEVNQTYIIVGGSLSEKSPWIPSRYDIINGVPYLKIERRDTGLCRFVGASTLQNATFIDDLIQERNRAVTEHAKKSFAENQSDMSDIKCSIDDDDLPETIDLHFPAFVHQGETYDSIVISTKFSVVKQSCASIALTAENLRYLRGAILHRWGDGQATPEGVLWCHRRKSHYVRYEDAVFWSEGYARRVRAKYFPHAEYEDQAQTELSKQAALDEATQFAKTVSVK